jgi:hypothetical protein
VLFTPLGTTGLPVPLFLRIVNSFADVARFCRVDFRRASVRPTALTKKGLAMKALLTALASLVITGCFSMSAHAFWCCRPVYPCYYPPCNYGCPYPRTAPDMCGPGFYSVNQCGAPYGPNYCVYPPFPPVGGMPPTDLAARFPTHPFARSPRDYFMLDH